MTLQKPARDLLVELYQRYQKTGDLGADVRYPDSAEEKMQTINTINQLVLAGYIEKPGGALGFASVRLTKAGIEYCEENE